MMCRCLRVSRSGYYAWTGRRPSRPARRRKELSALIEWVFNSSRGTYGYRRVHAAGARRGVETSPDTVRTRHALPGPGGRTATPKGPGATVPAAGPGLAPRPGPAGLPPPTGRESRWVGDITYIRTWEGFVYLAAVPGCCTKKAVGYAIGATTCAPSPLCEAIDMAVRRCPYTTGETILLPRAGAASTPPSSSATTWRATALALRWAGPGCAGRVPGRRSAGATLKEREGLSDGVSHKKQGHPGYCLPGRAGTHDQKRPHSALGHRTQGEVDQEHRAVRQAA